MNINPQEKTVAINESFRKLIVTDNEKGKTVEVFQPVTSIVNILHPGPRGPIGPIGPGGSGSASGSIDTGNLATTGSNTFIGNQIISGSLNVTLGITGSLLGSSSYATQALSSSHAITASYSILGYKTIESNSIPLNQREILNFSEGLTVIDSGSKTNVSLGGELSQNLYLYGTSSSEGVNVNFGLDENGNKPFKLFKIVTQPKYDTEVGEYVGGVVLDSTNNDIPGRTSQLIINSEQLLWSNLRENSLGSIVFQLNISSSNSLYTGSEYKIQNYKSGIINNSSGNRIRFNEIKNYIFNELGNELYFTLYDSGSGNVGINVGVSGGVNFRGLEYNNNYSSSFTTRSMPDVGWVTKTISESLSSNIYNFVTSSLNFGSMSIYPQNYIETTVSASWVNANSMIVISPSRISSSNHTAAEYLLEGIKSEVTNITPGESFTITSIAPNGTWGIYNINCTQIY